MEERRDARRHGAPHRQLPEIFPPFASELTAVGGTLFFVASDAVNGRGLWKSDGTPAGTVLVKGFGALSPYNLTAVGDTLFFVGLGTTGQELWKSDGTPAGTGLVKDIRPGSFDSFPTELTAVGGILYFVASDGVHGRELWKSDGMAAGTVLVKDINPGPADSFPSSGCSPVSPCFELTAVGGTLFFTADDGVHGFECGRATGRQRGPCSSVTSRWGGSVS